MAQKLKVAINNDDHINPLLKTANAVSTLSTVENTIKTQQINLLKSRVLVNIKSEGVAPKLPDPLKMEYGRLAVNYAKGYETLSTKNDADEIVEFKTIGYIKELIKAEADKFYGAETDTIKTDVVNNIITSNLKLSKTANNILTTKTDGVYTTFSLKYGEDINGVKKPGLLLLEAPNNVIQSVNLPLESFLVNGGYYEQFYDSNHQLHKKVIVLIVRDEAKQEKEIIIPIIDLVNIYTFEGDGRSIKVTTTPSAEGINNYDVNISLIKSPRNNNIFENTVDGAYVEDFRPYVDQSIINNTKEWKAYADKQDASYLTIAKQDAADKANKALIDAKAYTDALDVLDMHLSGGTFIGDVKFANGSSSLFQNGSTNTYASGSTSTFENGSHLVMDSNVKLNWGSYQLGTSDVVKWNNMMPLSGGNFSGNITFYPNTSLILGHDSSQLFQNDSVQTYEGGSVVNHEFQSTENYKRESVINHDNESIENYLTGSTIIHNTGAIESHLTGSIDTYETDSEINFNNGSKLKHITSKTDYRSGSTLNIRDNSVVTYDGNSQNNFNANSVNNFNNGAQQVFNCGAKQVFKCTAIQEFTENSKINLGVGSSANFNMGSILKLNNGSLVTHESGSTDTYQNGAIVNFQTGATTNHNGDIVNHNNESIVNYKSGSTQNIQSGSTEVFNGGSQSFNNNSSSTFNCQSTQAFKCDSTQTFAQDANQNFSGNSRQHFNVGAKTIYHNGSELIFENNSKETHASGATANYDTGSTINMNGGIQNFNCDSKLILKCNSQQNFIENSSNNFSGTSEQNFNNGTSQNFNSGSTQEFFQGSSQLLHIGSVINHESGSTENYLNGSTINFQTGSTTNHNSDVVNYNKSTVINYKSGVTQNIQSGSSINLQYGSSLEFTCLNGSKAQIDCSNINHWNDFTDMDETNPSSIKFWMMNWVKDYVHDVIGDLTTDLTKEYMPISGGTFTGGINFTNKGSVGSITGVTFDNNVPINVHSNHVEFYDGNVTFSNPNVTFDATVDFNKSTSIKTGVITNTLNTNIGSTTTFNGSTVYNNDTTHNRTITFPVKSGAYASNADIICRNGGPTQNITNIECSGSIDVGDGAYQQTSDITLKENIIDFECSLEQIENLSVIYFNYIGSDGQVFGTIAQEVQKICPALVHVNTDGKLKVDYTKLSLIALYGVKLLAKKVKNLDADITLIKNHLKLN